jgi:hypothetical protein
MDCHCLALVFDCSFRTEWHWANTDSVVVLQGQHVHTLPVIS